MATACTIRDFPKDLHRKATAATEGITLKELILKALAQHAEPTKKGE